MKTWFLISLSVLTANASLAQRGSDGLLWGIVGVNWQSDSAILSVEGTYQYLRYEQASRYFLSLGSLHLTHRLTRRGLSLTGGYVLGDLDQVGDATVIQLRLRQTWKQPRNTFYGQLTIDRLRTSRPPHEGDDKVSIFRLRTQLSAERQLNEHISLLLATEPFLLRGYEWFSEVRSQTGVRWRTRSGLAIGLFYLNRWTDYATARVNWEHYGIAEIIWHF